MSLTLDVTDIGRNIVRVEGTAVQDGDQLPAHLQPDYLAKYTERIAAMFGSAEQFAALFSAAVVITPSRLYT
ncbi:hypothetical protein BJ973_000606 [Actinoplanes tereljensis]|uniref:Uncharacterized protein n=1 Tax=Paractinoplanes tereljensis TaxID=571912 RepID=A0A919NS55_9ACTN|nr:hypothetical protein Ate02nite_57660 [Actinoplanes tereljensis]